jgi:hypothetical protein
LGIWECKEVFIFIFEGGRIRKWEREKRKRQITRERTRSGNSKTITQSHIHGRV